jgi:putative transposase
VCHKYLFARDSAKKARDKGYKNKYPYKKKDYYNTKWANNGFKVIEGGKIELSMGTKDGKRQKPIIIKTKKLPKGEIKEIELLYDNGLMFSISYDDEIEGIEFDKNMNKGITAIDPGEIHSIAAVNDNENKGIIITGRKIRSIKRLRSKKLAELQRKRSKCKKGSRKWKRYSRAIKYVLSKSAAQLNDALHKTTSNFVDWCLENDTKKVIIGDVEGLQRNTSRKNKNKKKRRSKVTNQKLSQWQFGVIYMFLEYKLSVYGIKISKESEQYTSQQCPCCGNRKKVSSRTYKCKCGYKEHRDIHGAKNILALYKYGEITDIGEISETKYLRIA